MDYSAVVLFDGECNLCSGLVAFIIPRDPGGQIHFAALQSEAGRQLLHQHGLETNALNTIVLIEGNQAYVKSAAALRICRKLNGLWPVMYILKVFPRPLRDWFYGWVARHRYRWFGKREQCMMPSPQNRNRFIE